MNPNPSAAKAQLVEKLRGSGNVLVTVSRNPSIDQLAACIAMTILLNKAKKNATAVFSGQVPDALEFLKPEETIAKSADSLRDFIIAIDKSKADKLRYKLEDDVVKIFITPYKTNITEKDLKFSSGEFNVDVILGLGVQHQQDLDDAIAAHGRIFHDAVVLCLNNLPGSDFGIANWQEVQSSSISEMVADLIPDFGQGLLDPTVATALLTGIVAETGRFSNEKTHPHTMEVSSQLLAAGADQKLVNEKLQAALGAEVNPRAAEQAVPTVEKPLNLEESNMPTEELVIDEHGELGTSAPAPHASPAAAAIPAPAVPAPAAPLPVPEPYIPAPVAPIAIPTPEPPTPVATPLPAPAPEPEPEPEPPAAPAPEPEPEPESKSEEVPAPESTPETFTEHPGIEITPSVPPVEPPSEEQTGSSYEGSGPTENSEADDLQPPVLAHAKKVIDPAGVKPASEVPVDPVPVDAPETIVAPEPVQAPIAPDLVMDGPLDSDLPAPAEPETPVAENEPAPEPDKPEDYPKINVEAKPYLEDAKPAEDDPLQPPEPEGEKVAVVDARDTEAGVGPESESGDDKAEDEPEADSEEAEAAMDDELKEAAKLAAEAAQAETATTVASPDQATAVAAEPTYDSLPALLESDSTPLGPQAQTANVVSAQPIGSSGPPPLFGPASDASQNPPDAPPPLPPPPMPSI